MNEAPPLRLFISYSHEDDSFRRELEKHLAALERDGVIEIWSDREIEAGTEWESTISDNLESADIIMLLISPDFLASDFCYDREMKRAMDRHAAGQARVIPVFLRHCDWKRAPFGRLQGVPDNARPIAGWPDRDQAFTIVAEAIRKAAQSLRSPKPPPPSTPPAEPPPTGRTIVTDLIRSWLSSIERIGNNMISHAKGFALFHLWSRQPRVLQLILLLFPASVVALIVSIPSNNSYETEPNGTFQTATTLNLRDTIGGDISTVEDIDYYKIIVPPRFSDRVDLKLSNRSGEHGFVPEMKVYSELQTQIDAKTGRRGRDVSDVIDMPSGYQARAFYLSIGGDDSVAKGTGPYELSVLPHRQ